MKKIRIAYFGISHPHVGPLYKTMLLHPDEAEIIGFADVAGDKLTTAERLGSVGPAVKQDFGTAVPQYGSWQKLLDEKPDVAVVLSDNRTGADLCVEALSRGIAVMGEKPMAMSMADAKRMYEASVTGGAPLITNWPIAWFAAFRKAKELADAGKIGKIMRVTYRSPATWGPFSLDKPNEDKARTWWYSHELGGGSILDYACYGTVLATWFFGKRARRVSAIKKQFTTSSYSDVEDYSAMMLDFGDGVGLLEGSWSTFNCGEVPSGPIIHGTEGTIVCDRYSDDVKVYLGASHTPVPPTEVYTAENGGQVELLGRNVLDFLQGRGELNEMLALDLNMDVVAALDAGIRSAESGRAEDVEQ